MPPTNTLNVSASPSVTIDITVENRGTRNRKQLVHVAFPICGAINQKVNEPIVEGITSHRNQIIGHALH